MVAVATRDLLRCWKVRRQTITSGLRAGRQQSAFAPQWLWRSERSVLNRRTMSSRMIRQGRSRPMRNDLDLFLPNGRLAITGWCSDYEARSGAELGVACDGAWVWLQLRCDRSEVTQVWHYSGTTAPDSVSIISANSLNILAHRKGFEPPDPQIRRMHDARLYKTP
jgi:hypothetical protein